MSGAPAQQGIQRRATLWRQIEPSGGIAINQAADEHGGRRCAGDAGLRPVGAAREAEEQDSFWDGELGRDRRGALVSVGRLGHREKSADCCPRCCPEQISSSASIFETNRK
jgi:hypothetical protein